MCAEEVRAEAVVCRFCRSGLRADAAAAKAPARAALLSADSYAGRVLVRETRWPAPSFVRRVVAAAIDATIVAVVGLPGGLLAAQGWYAASGRAPGLVAGGSALVLAALAYALTKDAWWDGAGIGKRILGLRVVHAETGAPCTVVRAIARGAAMVVLASVPYGGWAIEPLVVIMAAGGRRLGDHLAGTQVVTKPALPPV